MAVTLPSGNTDPTGVPHFEAFISLALRGKRLIKAWVRCWYEFEIYWFLMFSAG
jgi:hypothetical protein